MDNLQFEIKAVNEDGTFEGMASTYANIDKQGDRIEAGAFADDAGKNVPVLWAHKADEPIGLGKLEETPEGVKISGKLDLDTTAGREAYSRLKKGIVKSLSIGFQLLKHAFEGSVRVIQKGSIKEVSLVVFPANPKAAVTAVKDNAQPCAASTLLPYVQ
ncbi:MAG TPA: HK97 family phage prohead protease [Candidatus Nanoarchaeia archaeon]|nr:HK97 family phage prohead protease [Candidatus Nanoarchaeia archaeon]